MNAKSLINIINSCKDDTKMFVNIDGIKTKISQVSFEVASNEVIIYPKQNTNK